jgi:DNA-binding CsgD family transcriptional regulator
MAANMAALLSDLEGLSGEAAFKRKFESVFASLGFDSYTYISANVDDAELGKPPTYNDVIYLTNLPPKWVAHYVEESYADVDPIIKDCGISRLPIRWTDTYRANARTPAEALMMEDARENGLRRGLTIPVHGPRGELGIFSLNSVLKDAEFVRLTDQTQYDAQVIAYHFHDAARRVLQAERDIPLPIPLTDREVEILRWTAAGKTAWEIGHILHISERTVNFHIQNTMEKFGVHNKTHAAAKAMGLGLVSL